MLSQNHVQPFVKCLASLIYELFRLHTHVLKFNVQSNSSPFVFIYLKFNYTLTKNLFDRSFVGQFVFVAVRPIFICGLMQFFCNVLKRTQFVIFSRLFHYALICMVRDHTIIIFSIYAFSI